MRYMHLTPAATVEAIRLLEAPPGTPIAPSSIGVAANWQQSLPPIKNAKDSP